MAATEPVRFLEESMQPPATWVEAQTSVSAEAGLAVLLVAGHQPPQLTETGNNSICRAFQSSAAHAHLCEPYCGEAFERAQAAGQATYYRCHAGLHCFAMPVEIEAGRPLAVIGGRAFLSSNDYRELIERCRAGDLAELLSPALLRNVIFATQFDLERLAARLSSLAEALKTSAITPRPTDSPLRQVQPRASDDAAISPVENPDTHIQQSLCDASLNVLEKLSSAHGIGSAALLFRVEEKFVYLSSIGEFETVTARVCESLNSNRWDQVRKKGKPHKGVTLSMPLPDEGVELFPLKMNGELKGVIVTGGGPLRATTRQAVAEFCSEIALPLEVLRLREELARRMLAAYHLQSFTEVINAVEPEEAYSTILRRSVELLRSERGSLLLFDERANELTVRAAIGPRAEIARQMQVRLGEGICGTVLSEGRPLVVKNLSASGHAPAPAERRYKSESFISYPIIIGARKVGVLNMTDKLGGDIYDDLDLNLLELIAPHLALALDRAAWHQKATQFQLLSITDPLTGLVNRRYMEERLAEEVERSRRHRFEMSFLMLDIDNFKTYNDRHGHQAGDLALEMTAQCLKSALRSEDVASRYGGEEFSVLLPQTDIEEAHVIAERIRRRVERRRFPHGESQPHGAVTVSIGISALVPGLDTPAAVIRAADRALYAAKHRGKNCIETFSPQRIEAPSNNAD